MSPELPPCTVEGCERPTQEYLCAECTAELQDAWDQIGELLPVLVLISRNQEQAFATPTARASSGSAGSRPPMNLSAYQLHANLSQAQAITPNEYATHSDGAWSKWMIETWVTNADRMCNGENEDAESKANIAKFKVKDIPPMTVRHLLPWLTEKTGIKLTVKQVNKWAQRDKIKRTNQSGHPQYAPADLLAALADDRRAQ